MHTEIKINSKGKFECWYNPENKPKKENQITPWNIQQYINEWREATIKIEFLSETDKEKILDHAFSSNKGWHICEEFQEGVELNCIGVKIDCLEECNGVCGTCENGKLYAYFNHFHEIEESNDSTLHKVPIKDVDFKKMPNHNEFYFVIDLSHGKRIHRAAYIKTHPNAFLFVFLCKSQLK